MKICMLVTNSLRKDPRVQREALSAYNNGLDTVVIGCNDPNYDKTFLDSLPYRTIIYQLPIKYKEKLHNPIDKAKRMLLPIRNFTKICIKEKPDVIHANDFDTLPAAIAAAKKIHCKVVYDSHEIYTEQPSLQKYPIVKKFLQFYENILIKKADTVLSVSHAAAKELARKYNIKEPTVITNASRYCSEDLLLPKDKNFSIVYHGIINRNRGYEEFAYSAEITPEIQFVIRGYGDIKEELVNWKNKKGVDNLIFANPVEIKELIPYASKAYAAAVLTKPVSDNFKYTVSNKIFEYIQARIPIIMSDVPEHRYLNELYHIGIIIPEVTKEEISKAARRLYDDKDLYMELKKNVSEAAEKLCWESVEKELIRIYKQ